MFNIAERRRLWYTISALVIIPGIIAMIYSTITFGSPVRLSIDFTGGSLYEVKFEDTATEQGIREVYTDQGQDDPIIQRLGEDADNTWQIRAGSLTPEEETSIRDGLNEQVAAVDDDQSQFTNVDPSIGREVTIAAVLAVLAAAVVILGFIWIAFRRVPHAVRYGASAIAAMIHDVLITMGMMSILGIVLGWEVDALFLTAVLTVVAFSIQDSIVIFDRIRENLPKYRGETFERVVNRSVLETIHRSMATQLNAVFIMIAILLFGGATIKQFVAILLIGLFSGTYSSIFNAVPILVSWHKGELPFIKADAEA
jgi:preprotein translocase SecF subunit